MFSYYGSKSKIVKYYPPPKHEKIIEPFAGSARYSLRYWQNDILLVDKYHVIIEIWDYLINASEKDILGLPKMKTGDSLDNYNLSEIERKFMGQIVHSSHSFCRKVSSFVADTAPVLRRISKNLYKIRHWKTKIASYEELENETCTWFIDPPYQNGGHSYKCSNKHINFASLAEWCKSRQGQVIVCENTKANWLPFRRMVDMRGCRFKTTEAIWSNETTNFDIIQMEIDFN